MAAAPSACPQSRRRSLPTLPPQRNGDRRRRRAPTRTQDGDARRSPLLVPSLRCRPGRSARVTAPPPCNQAAARSTASGGSGRLTAPPYDQAAVASRALPEPAAWADEAEQAASRRLWAAISLAPDLHVCRSVLAGRPVLAGQLDPRALRRALRGERLPSPDTYMRLRAGHLDAVAEAGPLEVTA
jgi:hypothetical protein